MNGLDYCEGVRHTDPNESQERPLTQRWGEQS